MGASLDSLVILGLAVWQAVEIWHHSSLFAGWRSFFQSVPEPEDKPGSWLDAVPWCYRTARSWLASLLLCPWCTSVWVGGLLSAAWQCSPGWGHVATMGLAASRLANSFNDLMESSGMSRTPKATALPKDLKTGFEESEG